MATRVIPYSAAGRFTMGAHLSFGFRNCCCAVEIGSHPTWTETLNVVRCKRPVQQVDSLAPGWRETGGLATQRVLGDDERRDPRISLVLQASRKSDINETLHGRALNALPESPESVSTAQVTKALDIEENERTTVSRVLNTLIKEGAAASAGKRGPTPTPQSPGCCARPRPTSPRLRTSPRCQWPV